MPEKSMIQKSPIRIFERAISGGLGSGNLGLVLSRPGVGKTGFMIGLAVDQLIQGRKVLYISTKESVEHINQFFEQVFQAMAASLGFQQVLAKQLAMERNRHILVYNRDLFSLEKLEQSVAFLKEVTDFSPDMVIMDGTPRFESTQAWELEGLRRLGSEWDAEIWTSSNTHREDQRSDERGVPLKVSQHDEFLDVMVMLCPDGDHIKVKIVKEHGHPELPNVKLELDPGTLLLHWR